MKCPSCSNEIKQTSKYCSNCGNPNQNFRENLIDKHLDKTIETVQQFNKKVSDEFSESEHISSLVDNSKSKMKELNEALSNIFLFIGILTIVYSIFFEPSLYTNLFEYTKPTEFYGDAMTHFGYLFLYVSFLLLIPIGFIVIKISPNSQTKNYVIPLIILYIIFLKIYHQEFIMDLRWKDPNFIY